MYICRLSKKQTHIEVYGARVHNLKNIDVQIPHEKLVVITGLSGSGKSSLAFDTIYAEGQRRYIETFSAYARQFLGGLERPDVDKIDGLSPVISIEQKTTNKSPRSTVGTITEIYDFLRLLYARVADAYSYNTNEKMVQYTNEQISDLIYDDFQGKKIYLMSPVVKSRKGHYKELFQRIAKQGFVRVFVDGELLEVTRGMKLDRYKTHDISIVIDRLKVDEKSKKRVEESCNTALYHGENVLQILDVDFPTKPRYFSSDLMCPTTGIAYPSPEPNTFSFNSPKGACSKCNGLGYVQEVSLDKIIPDDSISIKKGGIEPLGAYKSSWIFKQIKLIADRYDFQLSDPINKIPKKAMQVILYGGHDEFEVKSEIMGITRTYRIEFDGVIPFIENQYQNKESSSVRRWAKAFTTQNACSLCNGKRLSTQSLHYKIDNKSISDLAEMDIQELANWFDTIESTFNKKQEAIGVEILKELRTRTQFLLDVGLDYLNLNRSSKTLSGGEAQRIRLATQIGSQLVGVLYILDEPSIGLHQRDNQKLIASLVKLRDVGNSVIIVEHDKDMIQHADYVFDIGPGAGIHGGEIVSKGTYKDLLKHKTLTADYLNGIKSIPIPKERRKGNGNKIVLKGCTGNNLKNVDVSIPLGKLICITGVSGSGKSTLINETLYPILNKHIYNGVKIPMPYKSISGLEHIDKVIEIDQSAIGRTPRSNPATYTGVFTEIRSLFANIPESKIRGYKPGRFSFNVKGGRCETCRGGGVRVIEMNFLPDVQVECETCQGKRFNRETLEVRYKGKSISDILNMTIENAVPFFEKTPKIHRKLKTLQDVGLDYITLGQPSTTLSGGEAQRIKLASELSKKATGNTLYILDEPTTGLHFEDIKILMEVIQKLVDKGNSVLIIEHNMDVIKLADYIIDVGKEGGRAGGEILCVGTPEEIIKNKNSYTAHFLKEELN